jgi:ABC-2 type transport system ATP-binding protein
MAAVSLVRDNQRYPDDFHLGHALAIAPVFHRNWDQKLANELISAFRLPPRTAVKKYSRGQMSSLGIVLGLASRAPLTIFDEPYLGLDATARRYFYDALMRDYLEHPRTILLSTHLIDEMEPLLEHVVILEAGRIVRAAAADDLRGSAVSVSGLSAAVDSLVAGRRVLQTRRIGSLSSLIVDGPADDRLRAEAARTGVEISSASLQDLVAAYGVDESAALEGARS